MDDLYSVVLEYKVNRAEKDFNVREECLAKISRQTVECCQFIKDYVSQGSFCTSILVSFPSMLIDIIYLAGKRLAKSTLASADTQIDGYRRSLEDLRDAFHDKIRVETRIFVSRIMTNLERIGEFVDLYIAE